MASTAESILIVEDNVWHGEVLKAIIRDLCDSEVRLCLSQSAVKAAAEEAFQIICLDAQDQSADGFALINNLGALFPRTKLIVVTDRRDDVFFFHLAKAPISAVVWRDRSLPSTLPIAVENALKGECYFPPAVKRAWAEYRQQPMAWFKLLTDRELNVVWLFPSVESDAELAAILAVHESTVRTHRQSIMRKLDIHSSAALRSWCLQLGLRSTRKRPDAALRESLPQSRWRLAPSTLSAEHSVR